MLETKKGSWDTIFVERSRHACAVQPTWAGKEQTSFTVEMQMLEAGVRDKQGLTNSEF